MAGAAGAFRSLWLPHKAILLIEPVGGYSLMQHWVLEMLF
jgi:hypothetical protein